jgi:transcriptional regulator with XRE-family HTH domain
MSLGENVRIARKQKGWSQRELAERVESDASYINRLETGKLNPSISSLERIADALECSIDHLVKGRVKAAEIQIRDKDFSERMRLIDALDDDDRKAITHIIDALLTKKRIRELLNGDQKIETKKTA